MKAFFHRRLQRIFITIIGLLMMLNPALNGAAQLSSPPHFYGTFLQLLKAHKEWSKEDWLKLFIYLRQLGLSQLVVQWTAYDDELFYFNSDQAVLTNPPLETILQLADESEMQVLVGLIHDSHYWEKIRSSSSTMESYLWRLFLRSSSVATQLASLVQKHPCFQGWYITEEIDDINWQVPEARKILFSHLRDLSKRLHELTPGKKVALSGFSNARSDPQAFETFWRDLLNTAAVDIVLFQDGIGVKKLQLSELPLYLGAIQRAVQTNSRELQIVVEIFRQVSGPPMDTQRFQATPASLEDIHQQLELAAQYSPRLVAFSIPEYMTPLGGAEAERLFQNYLAQLRGPTH